MTRSTLANRIFLAHLELSYRTGRKVTLAEFGERIAKEMGRSTPFTAGAVSRWENGTQAPTPEVIEAIATLTSIDPGWISHGEKSAAPSPRGEVARTEPTLVENTGSKVAPRAILPPEPRSGG